MTFAPTAQGTHLLQRLHRRICGDLDDELVILTSLVASGGASVTLCQRIRHSEDGPDLAVLDIQLACIGMNDSRPARIPPEWREAMGLMDGA